mgnify:CR=1 FL=1
MKISLKKKILLTILVVVILGIIATVMYFKELYETSEKGKTNKFYEEIKDKLPLDEKRVVISMKKYDLNNNVKYLKHIKNMNGAVARNTGIKNCNGDYIGFLDDDDEFLPEKIEKQVKILNRTKKFRIRKKLIKWISK